MKPYANRSPFDRLRQHYERKERACVECGYVDLDARWSVTKRGHEIHYQHVCPRCDSIETHVLRYD
ncbi:HVO_0649 family zinc finger protein [Haladaptatus sp.]|uniref:HVO_0649 family zinc finger protein n=1 Tax=Haladaptatus sp. TaxID=1973141 RepID=UPI003C4D82A6